MALSERARAGAFGPAAATLRAIVVVPARDEEQRIGACLDALAAQSRSTPAAYEVIVVLDACADGTEREVEAARRRWPRLRLLTSWPAPAAAPARPGRPGMDVACARLESVGAGRRPARHHRRRLGRRAGLDRPPARGDRRRRRGDRRRDPARPRRSRPPAGRGAPRPRGRPGRAHPPRPAPAGPAEHAHFAGASLGLTPRAYRRAGGMGWLAALEDQELEDRLADAGVAIHRLRPVRVDTSARTDGRAERGLALRPGAGRAGCAERSYDGGDFALERLLAAKRALGRRDPARPRGGGDDRRRSSTRLLPLREAGLVDELLVVDADSADGTAAIARARGAEVVSESALAPELGPCLRQGRRDVAGGRDRRERAARLPRRRHRRLPRRASSPACSGRSCSTRRRRWSRAPSAAPSPSAARVHDGEGGRVTELVARPLLNLHFPALAGFVQPLAGEIAIARDLFGRLPVPVGYGVEIAMLIDACAWSGSTRWPRSTSAPARTATSRCAPSARWRSR